MTVFPNGLKTKPAISSKYGPRTGGAFNFHYGCDFIGYASPCAVEGGVVTTAGWLNDDAGNTVAYDLPWKGPKGETITIVHMHLNSIAVKKGQRVTEGQHLGAMGDTGNADGKCDHVEVRYWLNGVKTNQDPDPWLTARVLGGSTAGTGSTTDLYGVAYTKVAQTFLASLGLYSGDIDGIAGALMVAGTKKFQELVTLAVDGVFGPDTNAQAMIVKAGGNFTARAVTEIQTFLKGQGVYDTAIDGAWGNQTSFGTLRYQIWNGLTRDAQWGPATDAKAFPPVTPPPTPPAGPVGKNITQRPTTVIQTMLTTKGLYTGPVDGDYGAGTTAAVTALQAAGGLVADGIYGAVTDVFAFKRSAFLKTAKQGVSVDGGTVDPTRKITGINVHHYGSIGDDRAYFANPLNGRKSCPTVTAITTGELDEYIRPSLQPWSTGVADEDRISIEFQNSTGAPDWQISAKQIETFINLLVELRMASINKELIDGMEVDFVLDRQHIQGDQEFRATVCPGPYIMNNLVDWIAEAQKRVDALTPPVEPPVEPKVEIAKPDAEEILAAGQYIVKTMTEALAL